MAVMEPLDLADHLIETLTGRIPPDQRDRVQDAIDFAAETHAGEQRPDGRPFLSHPLRVALILAEELGIVRGDVLCAALLHDVLEHDESIPRRKLAARFGANVLAMVDAMTKPPKRALRQAERTAEYQRAIRHASEAARVAKLADRLDNMRAIGPRSNPNKARRKLAESRRFYLPLIQTIANQRIRDILRREMVHAIRAGERVVSKRK